jgi:hypothetical protein
MTQTKPEKFRPHYSGPASKKFWAHIKNLPDSRHDEMYALGCILQDIEYRVLAGLANIESAEKARERGA